MDGVFGDPLIEEGSNLEREGYLRRLWNEVEGFVERKGPEGLKRYKSFREYKLSKRGRVLGYVRRFLGFFDPKQNIISFYHSMYEGREEA